MSKTHHLIAASLLSIATLGAGLTVAGADAVALQPDTLENPAPAPKTFEPPFKAGNFDFTLSAGFAALLYPHIEPGAEFGLIPLGNDLTLGIGAMVDLGYCLLCPLITALAPGVSVSSWYVNPMARVNLHLGPVAQILELPQLDAFVGAVAGPSIYRLTVEFDELDASTSGTRATLMLGPVIGARFSLDDTNSWLIFGEARFLLEVGFEETVLRIDDREYRESGNSGRGGLDVVFGLGYRI